MPRFLVRLFLAEMASRILQVGPVGSKFLGPIVIDVPHVASLRSGVRETAILRCDSASEGKWVEHKQKALEDSLKVSHVGLFSGSSKSVDCMQISRMQSCRRCEVHGR